jgi:hypothetical protein
LTQKPTTNKYKEPGIARKKAKHVDSDDKNEDASAADKTSLKKVGRPATSSAVVRKPRKVAGDIDDALMSSKRAVRQSTNNKTKEALSAQKRASSMKSRVRFRPPIKHQFTQQELLLDALTTEVHHRISTEIERRCECSLLRERMSSFLLCSCLSWNLSRTSMYSIDVLTQIHLGFNM